jgi:endonuclease-3
MASRKIRPLNATQRVAFFTSLQRHTPRPETELEYTSPYELLIAVMLSAQATDRAVNKATRSLFRIASTPQAMCALGIARIEQQIRTIGLFRTKAKNVWATSQRLITEFDGQVPNQRAALESLPGVGRKTANVLLNTLFGAPTVAVDTHIFRVANRTGLAPGRDVVRVEQALLARTPDAFIMDCHHWLILLGRYICKARRPECWHCPVHAVCNYAPKTAPPAAALEHTLP